MRETEEEYKIKVKIGQKQGDLVAAEAEGNREAKIITSRMQIESDKRKVPQTRPDDRASSHAFPRLLAPSRAVSRLLRRTLGARSR